MDNEFELWLKKVEAEIKKEVKGDEWFKKVEGDLKKDEAVQAKADEIYHALDLKVNQERFQIAYNRHIQNYGNKLLFVVTPERIPQQNQKIVYQINLIEYDYQKSAKKELFDLVKRVQDEPTVQLNPEKLPDPKSQQSVNFITALIERHFQLEFIAHHIFMDYYDVMPKCQAISSTYVRDNNANFKYLFFPEPRSTRFGIMPYELKDIVLSPIFERKDLEEALQTKLEEDTIYGGKFNFSEYYWLSLAIGIGYFNMNEYEINEMVNRLMEISKERVKKAFPINIVDNLNELDSGTIVQLKPNLNEVGIVRGTVLKL